MSNDKIIWDKLIAAGLTPAGAAGLMGNLYAESGLRPDNLQNSFEKKLGYSDADYTVAVDCGACGSFVTDGAGYGLAQWTYPSRKAALLACAKAQGRSIGDLDMQLGYLLQELQSLFPAVLDKLRTTDSVREASDCVLLRFERPADQSPENCARRAGFAQEFYDKFAKEGNGLNLPLGGKAATGLSGPQARPRLKCILTENRCCKNKSTIKPKGVMVHSTGKNNPLIRRYVQPVASTPDRGLLLDQLGTNRNGNDWNREGQWVQGKWVPLDACVHAFIGKLDDGSVAAVQTLPWNHRGWHAGTGSKGSANNTHISFEMCEDDLTDPVYFQQVYQAAVELTAMLCQEYGLDPLADGVVICHQDGYKRGIASNHGDVYNWFPKHGKSMDDFRADVVRVMKGEDDDMTYYKTIKDVPEWYRPSVQKAVGKGALNGTGSGELNVSEDLCRTLTVLDRLGKLD